MVQPGGQTLANETANIDTGGQVTIFSFGRTKSHRAQVYSVKYYMHAYIDGMCFPLCFLRTLLSAFNAKRVQHLREGGRGKMGK